MREALFYSKSPDHSVQCNLCRIRCRIKENMTGRCGVRQNTGGTLYTLVYGNAVADSLDPIEKKPLYHFFPGSRSYSIATVGCNFDCLHCQNYHISKYPKNNKVIQSECLSPEDIVKNAVQSACRSISYTYTEPTVFFEYALDTAKLAHEKGIRNVFVTNGYITDDALQTISPFLDAANIDLKGFTEEFYRKIAGVSLSGVLDTIRAYKKLGIWIELTTLIIPGYNDDEAQIRGMAEFISTEIGKSTPWHLSAFHPTHQLKDVDRTPESTLHAARKIGLEAGLQYVYEGNISSSDGSVTFCPVCRQAVIRRRGFSIIDLKVHDGRCGYCSGEIAGYF